MYNLDDIKQLNQWPLKGGDRSLTGSLEEIIHYLENILGRLHFFLITKSKVHKSNLNLEQNIIFYPPVSDSRYQMVSDCNYRRSFLWWNPCELQACGDCSTLYCRHNCRRAVGWPWIYKLLQRWERTSNFRNSCCRNNQPSRLQVYDFNFALSLKKIIF